MKIARWPTRSGTSGQCATSSRSPSVPTVAESRSSPTPLLCSTRPERSPAQSTFVLIVFNLLIDVTEEQSEALHEQAERCRRLADATYDRATSKVLGEMASGFENIAGKFRAKER